MKKILSQLAFNSQENLESWILFYGLLEAGPQPEGGDREIDPPKIFTNVFIC